MFTPLQKRLIAHKVQQILRATGNPELPKGEITFRLHVEGAEDWSWADIKNNGAVPKNVGVPDEQDLPRALAEIEEAELMICRLCKIVNPQHAECTSCQSREDLIGARKILEKASKDLEGLIAFKRSVDEALNMGDGTYRP